MSEISWEITSLSELGTFSRGKSKHRPRNDVKLFEGGKYPLVQTGDVKAANLYITKNDSYYNDFGLKQSKLWPAGTLCITIAANIAETAILSYPMCFPDSIVGFNANPEKSSELFVYYFFEYIKKEIQKSASGSIQDNINIDYLSKMRIKVPEKKYQDKIVELLSSIDKKILLNNQINQELEAMAKTLYDYWFVQFDFPDQNGKPYKSSGGKMVYHPELKREIPEGWGVENLFDVAEVQYGYPFSTDYFNSIGEGIPVIRIRDILGNDITNYSTEEVEDKYKINVGDVLIGMDGNFHMNYWIKEDCYLNQRVVKVNSDKLPNMVLKYQIEPFIKLREKSVSRTTVGHLSDKDLKAINVILPKEKYLSSIFDKFESILENIIINQQQNQELTQLRDWLLPMLMNGQVKVE